MPNHWEAASSNPDNRPCQEAKAAKLAMLSLSPALSALNQSDTSQIMAVCKLMYIEKDRQLVASNALHVTFDIGTF